MGDRKRQMEKEAKRILKKLRKSKLPSEEAPPSPPRRKFHGPAKPSHLADQKPEIGPEIPEFLKREESEEEMIGPLPPEAFDEIRSHDEVERIMTIFKSDESFANPFEILQVDSNMTDSQVKKAFWKCSLAVHPDKSNHPEAHQAFQILNEAWKKIQSAESRKAWEEENEKKMSVKQMEIGLKKEQRKREWDVVLNPGKVAKQPSGREEWMTQLPELRRQPQQMKQVNVTSFSRKEYSAVDDDVSGWTHQPMCPTVQGPRIPYQGIQSQKPDTTRSRKPSLLQKHLDKSDGNKKHNQSSQVESMLKNTGSLHDRFR